MTINHRLTTLVSVAAFGLAAAACTPADNDRADSGDTHTVVEKTVEVPGPPVVVERDSPPIVIDGQPTGDSTTVRAGRDGLEVETTNR
jgi:hypothetical protein